MKTNKLLIGVSVVALVLAGFAFYTIDIREQSNLTAAAVPGSQLIEQYSPEVLYNGGINSALPIQTSSTITAGNIVIGTGGTQLSHVVAPANCTVIAASNTITASSSTNVDCAVAGILPTDTVYPVATTSISGTYLGVDILAAHASTTPGFATLTVNNGTGATFTWTNTASTSIRLFGLQ